MAQQLKRDKKEIVGYYFIKSNAGKIVTEEGGTQEAWEVPEKSKKAVARRDRYLMCLKKALRAMKAITPKWEDKKTNRVSCAGFCLL